MNSKMTAEELAAADRQDAADHAYDQNELESGRITRAEFDAREAKRRTEAAARTGEPAAEPVRVAVEPTPHPGPFAQPATIGTFNAAGQPVRVLPMPPLPDNWVPGTIELVARDGDAAIGVNVFGEDGKPLAMGDLVDHLRLAMWHVKHGATLPPAAPALKADACPVCGAPHWARDARRVIRAVA